MHENLLFLHKNVMFIALFPGSTAQLFFARSKISSTKKNLGSRAWERGCMFVCAPTFSSLHYSRDKGPLHAHERLRMFQNQVHEFLQEWKLKILHVV